MTVAIQTKVIKITKIHSPILLGIAYVFTNAMILDIVITSLIKSVDAL